MGGRRREGGIGMGGEVGREGRRKGGEGEVGEREVRREKEGRGTNGRRGTGMGEREGG